MEPSFLEILLSSLKSGKCVQSVFQTLTTLTTPDDSETSASQTFMHARLLAQQKFHLSVVDLLQQELQKVSIQTLSALMDS